MVAVPPTEEHSTINQIMHEELETPWDIFPSWIFIFIRETL